MVSASVVVKTFLGLKTETLDFRSWDRDLDKMNLSALESQDHGLKITSLAASIPVGDSTRLKVLQITIIVLQA